MSSPQIIAPLDPPESRKRRREGIAIVTLFVLLVILTVAEVKLSNISSTLPFVNSIFFFGLLNINLIILVTLCWLVFRNIGKLFIERRRRVLGSRLKTKLVIAFVAFSLIPTLSLFLISAAYINSSFDKWFSIKIQNTLQASLEITRTYYRNADQTAMHFAEHIAKGVGSSLARRPMSVQWLNEYLEAQRELLALDGVEFYSDPLDERVLIRHPGGSDEGTEYPRLPLDLLERAFAGERVSQIQYVGTGDLIRSLAPVYIGSNEGTATGVTVVNTFIPVSLNTKVDEIANVFDDYKATNPLKYPMKTMYFILLVMITLVIIFLAIWIALYMARELTVPLQRLVYGAQAVGAGNLDVTITGTGHDEIAVLVNSFNRMTLDLRENRARLTHTSADLEKRRLQLEAILANVGTGVLVVDRSGDVTTLNRAASHLFGLTSEQAVGQKYLDAFKAHEPLVELIARFIGGLGVGIDGPEVTQWNLRSGDNMSTLAAIATPLLEPQTNAAWGVVVVIDDMTHLIKGQREMAWREVARRIAHEIKNPLTPIKLSAQRLQRRLGGYGDRDAALLKECTDTIIKHTDELKEMVNEFSNFARFPEISPAPNNLNEVVKEVSALFAQAHPGITFVLKTEPRLPIFEFDRDQIKRVLINFFDNAVAVFDESFVGSMKRVDTETHFNAELKMAVVTVKDNGSGMSEEVKARLFEPYFSTKKDGTGLGLAIAKRIINDHDGFIRVQSAPGEGTQFLIELPTSLRFEQKLT